MKIISTQYLNARKWCLFKLLLYCITPQYYILLSGISIWNCQCSMQNRKVWSSKTRNYCKKGKWPQFATCACTGFESRIKQYIISVSNQDFDWCNPALFLYKNKLFKTPFSSVSSLLRPENIFYPNSMKWDFAAYVERLAFLLFFTRNVYNVMERKVDELNRHMLPTEGQLD